MCCGNEDSECTASAMMGCVPWYYALSVWHRCYGTGMTHIAYRHIPSWSKNTHFKTEFGIINYISQNIASPTKLISVNFSTQLFF